MSEARVVGAAPERWGHPAGTARPRPDLRIVREGELGERARRRRRRLAVSAGAALLVASLFGVVAFHVVLTEGQLELEQLRERAAAERARNTRLRVEVARWESPGWIVAAALAQDMEPAENMKFLSPSGPQAPR